ncbi:MAG: hypothetical protein VYE22_31155 [Myxococcota bacterium]|nr:hypothetical protein [Myxococcota bacterium]
MRALTLALLLTACGGDDDDAVPEMATGTASVAVEAEGTAEVDAPAAPHGGRVVSVGAHAVEVVAHDDGVIDAFVLGDAPEPAQVQLTVSVSGDDGEVHPVLLTWHPSEGRYQGRMHHAQPIPGPVEIAMTVSGERAEGRAPRLLVLAPEPAAAPPRSSARATTARAPSSPSSSSSSEAAPSSPSSAAPSSPPSAAAPGSEPPTVEVPAPSAPVVRVQPAPGVVAVQPPPGGVRVRPARPAAPPAAQPPAAQPSPAQPSAAQPPAAQPSSRGGIRVRSRAASSTGQAASPASPSRGGIRVRSADD